MLLGSHVLVQPCLIDEAALVLLMLAKKLGLLPVASNKRLKKDGGQKTKIDEERRDRKARPSEYPAWFKASSTINTNDDILKGAPGLV